MKNKINPKQKNKKLQPIQKYKTRSTELNNLIKNSKKRMKRKLKSRNLILRNDIHHFKFIRLTDHVFATSGGFLGKPLRFKSFFI